MFEILLGSSTVLKPKSEISKYGEGSAQETFLFQKCSLGSRMSSYFKCDSTSRSFTPSSFITASLWHVREANVFFPGLPPLLKEAAGGKAINYLEVKYCLFVIKFVIHKLIFLRLNHPCSFWVCLDLLLRREWMF